MSDNGGRVTIWDVVKVFFIWGMVTALSTIFVVYLGLVLLDTIWPPKEGAQLVAFLELGAGVLASPIGFVIGGVAGVHWSRELR